MKRVLVIALMCWVPLLAQADNGCIDCHESGDFFAKYPKLHRYFEDWVESPHGESNVNCDDCHGGDPRAETAEAAHSGVLAMNDPGSTLFNKNQPGTCGDCHRAKRRQFIESKHYQALMEDRNAPTCTTCHPAMNQRPSFRKIVLNACRNCHHEGNEQELPLVADQAEEAFHQLNVAAGFLGWAKLHFESLGWPGNSRQRIDGYDSRIATIVDRIHRFDLDETRDRTLELRADLNELFDAAREGQADLD